MRHILATLALSILTFAAHAQVTTTSETAAFYRDGGELTNIPKLPNYINRVNLADNVSYTFTIPSWATSGKPGKGGLVVITAIGGNYGACVWNAGTNRCASPTFPWPGTSPITNGVSYDLNPKFYWLEPLNGTAPTSITFVAETSGTKVFVKFYKTK